MTPAAATRFSPLGRSLLASMSAVRRFLATSSLARSVVGLLAGAILLLLMVNFSTYVLIRRTAEVNARIEVTQLIRRSARSALLNVQYAETAQRGFILTGQSGFLEEYDSARAATPALLRSLHRRVEGDDVAEASVEALDRLSRDKYLEMSATLALAQQGRVGEAVRTVRAGQGKALMDQLRAEIDQIDAQQSRRVAVLSRQSEQSAVFTVAVNAVAALLILVLAGIISLLIRRYLTELNEARSALDHVNAGLEETVRGRTAALTRANEEVQRFAYIVSHDLRSPLVNVMGYTAELEQAGRTIDRQISRLETERPDLVERDVVIAVREDIPEAVGFIRASTEKMDRLINAILKLSREGRRTLVPEMLDMTAMVARITDSVRHQTEEAGAEIVVGDLPPFENDRLSIEQVMGNLIDNAVKYLEPARPGRIVVTGQTLPDGRVEYVVADNGRGISGRDHERIFELFRRSGRQDRPGEGLGLAFVRNNVRRLGGSIDVESELGTGSTFRLKFPTRLILVEAGDTL